MRFSMMEIMCASQYAVCLGNMKLSTEALKMDLVLNN